MMLWMGLLACRAPAPAPGMPVEEVAAYVRSDVGAPEVWARAVRSALLLAERPVDEDHVCQVLAVIEQESGYQADPEVAGLAGIVEGELEAELAAKLGFLADGAASLVLDVAPVEDERTFRQQLRQVRTERDLDQLFQAIVRHHEAQAPAVGTVVRTLAPRLVERMNPVTTAGSMQVKVDWAQAHPVSRRLDPTSVRASMYTVDGGVRFGTLRLFATADYADPIHRFADFNAGPYASRNAAFQKQIGELGEVALTLDGDLLTYTGRGRPRATQGGETWRAALALGAQHGLEERQLERDLRREKELDLEVTPTWMVFKQAHREAYEATPYAVVPKVQLDSPKLHGTWTTASFAGRVQRRYEACLARA